MFSCTKCCKEFKTKQDYTRHMNRKTSCVKEIIKCDNCLQEFKTNQNLTKHLNRKFKCEKVDLKMENIELKYQLKIEKLKQRPTYINNINNNFIMNNFGDEAIHKIKCSTVCEQLNKVFNNKLLLKPANYKVDEFEYTNEDITEIDIFRLFVKLIFNNKELPQNKTLTYDTNEDKFYYYIDNEWLPFESVSNNALIKIIFKKIQAILIDKMYYFGDNIKELSTYVGNEYDININTIDETDPELLDNHTGKQVRYVQILKLDYKKKFNIHQINEIELLS